MTDNERFKLFPKSDRNNVWYGLFDNEELEYVADVWNGADRLCKRMNELNDENIGLKQIIREAYVTERTKLGKSVLRQLLNQIKEV